jgi:hypothetical protein
MTLGTLNYIVGLDATQFNTGVNEIKPKIRGVKNDLDSLGKTTEKTKSNLEIAFAHALGDAISDMAGTMTNLVFEVASDGVVLAGDMQSIGKRLNLTFGSSAISVDSWAKSVKSSFGIGRIAASTYAADLGESLKDAASSEMDLANMSMRLAEIAGDLGAAFGTNAEKVVEAMKSAFRGEADSIEKYGLDMSASAMALFAAKKGFIEAEKDWSKLSESEKDLARYAYILEATADKQGFFADNANDYNQQIEIMNANIEALKTSVGQSLLPVMTELVTWFNALFGGTKSAQEGIEDVQDTYGKSFASIEATVTQAKALIDELNKLSTATDDAAAADKWSTVVESLKKTIPGIGELIGEETGKIQAGADALRAFVDEYELTSKRLAQMEAMRSTTDAYNKLATELAGMEMRDYLNEIRQTAAQGEMDSALGEVFSYIQKGMESSGVGGKFGDVKAIGSDQLVAMLRAIYSGKDVWSTMYDYIGGFPELDTFWDYFSAGGGTEDIVKALANQFIANEENADKYGKDYDEDIKKAKADLQALSEEITLWKQILQDYDKKPDGTGSSEDVADAAAAGAKKGAAEAPGDNITIQNHFYVDSNEVANVMVPKVINKLNWKLQAQTKG